MRPTGKPTGRPKVVDKHPELTESIAECFLVGFTDEQTALCCGISAKTVQRLRRGGFCPSIKKAELVRERIYRLKIYDGAPNWQGIAWFLERKYPTQFAKPEIQLAVNQQVNTGPTNVVVLGPERAKELVSRHEAIRAKTLELLDKQHSNGDKNGNSTTTE
jgi:hypothetical protein